MTIKIRVQCLPEQVEQISQSLSTKFDVLDQSKPYANTRHNSKYVRVYFDVLLKNGEVHHGENQLVYPTTV